MPVNPIVPNSGNQSQPQQVNSSSGKDPEGAFGQLAKSQQTADEYKDEVDKQVRERTRLTRTKKADKSKSNNLALLMVNEDGKSTEAEPVYRTIMVDGVMFTLRLLAVA